MLPRKWLDRREALVRLAAAGGVGAPGAVLGAPSDPLSGAVLFEDVQAYDAMGEHRTATAVDHATSRWLLQRLGHGGMNVRLQSFAAPLFEPEICRIDVGPMSASAFPAWPVRVTPGGGVKAPLRLATDSSIEGRIALIRLPYTASGTWARTGFGDAVTELARRGAAAIVAITEGPTGEVIALNAVPELFAPSVPVVLMGAASGDELWQAASYGRSARLISTGATKLTANATNVVARRKGRGKTIVISTPKSGWFNCAGERGTGIAIFIAMANWLTRNTDADLLFVASSGHELDELGGTHFLKTGAPEPDSVRCWLHIGANAAMQGIAFDGRKPIPAPYLKHDRRITVSQDLLSAAKHAFGSDSGYGPPLVLDAGNALGELALFQKAGYRAIAGLLEPNAVFHTRLDRAPLVTTPRVLEAVARACRDFLIAIL